MAPFASPLGPGERELARLPTQGHRVLVALERHDDVELLLDTALAIVDDSHGTLTLMASAKPPLSWALGTIGSLSVLVDPHCFVALAEDLLRRAARLVPGDVPLATVVGLEGLGPAVRARSRSGAHDLVLLRAGRGPARRRLCHRLVASGTRVALV